MVGRKYKYWNISPEVAIPATDGIMIYRNLFFILLQQLILSLLQISVVFVYVYNQNQQQLNHIGMDQIQLGNPTYKQISIIFQVNYIQQSLSQLFLLMEITLRRKFQNSQKKYLLPPQIQPINLLNQSRNIHNSTLLSTFDASLPLSNNIQSSIINQTVRAKASMLLSLPITPRVSVRQSNSQKQQTKLSFMFSPKKKITVNLATESFRRRKQLSGSKFSNFNHYESSRTNITRIKRSKLQKNTSVLAENREGEQQKQNNVDTNQISEKGYINKIFSLSEYFSLVFSKMLSTSGKQNIYIFIQQLALRYQKNPQTIQQDVTDMKAISDKLLSALGPKENYIQLRPFQALQVNGQIARLIFHLAHDITARKYKNFNLIKIYKEIQYCTRKLQFNKLTLRVCFQLGQLYKQQYDQMNSHAYLVKAFKLSIFIGDKFYEQKIIDYLGLTAFYSSKSGQAYYFHHNINNLDKIQRQMIQEKYSNVDQLEKITKQREESRVKCQEKQQLKNFFYKTKQSFNFNTNDSYSDYQLLNRQKFKQKISSYIQCPIMRANTLIARNYINKINKIGKIKRYKDWKVSHNRPRYNGGQFSQSCSQVLLSHRSLNRKNPQYENKIVQKQRKILLELINYYINQNVQY